MSGKTGLGVYIDTDAHAGKIVILCCFGDCDCVYGDKSHAGPCAHGRPRLRGGDGGHL